MIPLLLVAAALAVPLDDPGTMLADKAARAAGTALIRGGSDRDPLALAWRIREAADAGVALNPVLSQVLGPELAVVAGPRPWSPPPWVFRPRGRAGGGDLVPDNAGGDTEPGLFSLRLAPELRAWPGPLELALRPSVDLDLAPGSASVGLPEAWAGLRTRDWTLGFGVRDRQVGPGQHGALLLSDNAAPAPLGSFAWQSPPARRWGRLRAEMGAGWLNAARTDVERPGWLLMDARYAWGGWVEAGATRMAIFGGEGRPAPELGQLLLPTEPHIYDDPEHLLPDQNELASLDLRVTVPLRRLLGRGPVDAVEIWWQYGGEDVIAKEALGIPYPSLAGVANLMGATVDLGPVSVTGEGARILDDSFRWYTGHRVYHAGFTQADRAMGHEAGGDSLSGFAALTWLPGPWGAQISAERLRRVGVVGASGDHLFALASDELHHRVGLTGWRAAGTGWWRAGISLEQVTGVDFVPGTNRWAFRASVGR